MLCSTSGCVTSLGTILIYILFSLSNNNFIFRKFLNEKCNSKRCWSGENLVYMQLELEGLCLWPVSEISGCVPHDDTSTLDFAPNLTRMAPPLKGPCNGRKGHQHNAFEEHLLDDYWLENRCGVGRPSSAAPMWRNPWSEGFLWK
jgi:hypothetical protein